MGNNENTSILKPGDNGAGASLQRVGFGTTETQLQRETQGTALAARAQAEVQARYIVALQRPRNVEDFRVRLLGHCKRPGFALVAEYEKPVGGQKIKGPSIRFVETAVQEFSNVLPEETITYDDDYKRVTRVAITDLERNITYYGDVIVDKTVERKKPKDGDEILGSRLNSYQETVYKIRATEDDFANKVGSACSKKLRNLGLRILPADIVSEAMETCRKTRQAKDAQDPAAARRQLADAFAELRVLPADLDAFLGHAFDQAAPAELEELRGAYVTIRDGEARWNELVDAQRVARGEIEQESKATANAGDKMRANIEKARARQQEKQAQQQGQAPAAATGQQQAAPQADKKASQPAAKPAAAPAAKPAANPQANPQATAAPAAPDGVIDGNCTMCGVPIELAPADDPTKARCEACASE